MEHCPLVLHIHRAPTLEGEEIKNTFSEVAENECCRSASCFASNISEEQFLVSVFFLPVGKQRHSAPTECHVELFIDWNFFLNNFSDILHFWNETEGGTELEKLKASL